MYLSLIQIAESFGVSESVVEGWVRDEGMPHTPERGRLLFDRAQVVQWAATRGLATKAGFLTPEQSSFTTGCELVPLLQVGGIHRGVSASSVLDVLGAIVGSVPGAPARSCPGAWRRQAARASGVLRASDPASPGMPSAVSPVSARKSGTLVGAKPRVAR